ncbi:MAG TPA: lipid-A-disaccharide synthase N-terminal domain-containing protein [Chryseolinea sp.]|nr:lipid-A-disaccharide synthase N-terminal domain-containing protein [Chryseolinea sp.]
MIQYFNTHWIFGFGFFAQAIFGTRILLQWWMTEKKGQVVSPNLFWRLSLLGSVLFLAYGILRYDVVIVLGQLVAYFIYLRNLQLKKDWSSYSFSIKLLLLALPVIAILWILERSNGFNFKAFLTFQGTAMVWIGIIGQLLLNFRFLYQLHYSEKRGESLLPLGFWWISLGGAVLVTIYSVYRRDPVLFLAQSLALIPYLRNIVISRK